MKPFKRMGFIFFSWRLWQQLAHPPENPIYRRTVKKNLKFPIKFSHSVLVIFVVGFICYRLIVYLTQFNLPFSTIVLTILGIFTSAITIFWIINFISGIAHEQHGSTYDLICITALGTFNANLSIVTGVLHKHDLFNWVNLIRKIISGLLLIVLMILFIALISVTFEGNWTQFITGILLLIEIIIFALISYVEYVQSVTLGTLIAILIPQHSGHSINIYIGAVLLFIVLQIVIFIIFYVSSLFAQAFFILHDWKLQPILPQLLFLYFIREGCIYLMWNILSSHLNID